MKGKNAVEGEATQTKISGETAPRMDHSTNDKMRDDVELYDKRVKECDLKQYPVYQAN